MSPPRPLRRLPGIVDRGTARPATATTPLEGRKLLILQSRKVGSWRRDCSVCRRREVSMIRATDLSGRAVVDMDAAEKLGRIETIIIDPEARQLAAFRLSRGGSLL